MRPPKYTQKVAQALKIEIPCTFERTPSLGRRFAVQTASTGDAHSTLEISWYFPRSAGVSQVLLVSSSGESILWERAMHASHLCYHKVKHRWYFLRCPSVGVDCSHGSIPGGTSIVSSNVRQGRLDKNDQVLSALHCKSSCSPAKTPLAVAGFATKVSCSTCGVRGSCTARHPWGLRDAAVEARVQLLLSRSWFRASTAAGGGAGDVVNSLGSLFLLRVWK